MNERNELPQLPKGWVWTTIEEILQALESGGRPKGGAKGITQGVPSIGGEHLLYSGGFDFSQTRYVPEEFYEKMTRGKIAAKDVLVVKDGATTGKTSFVSENFPFKKAAVNEHVFILRVFEDCTNPKYLFFWMQSPFGQRCVADNFQGTAQGGITSTFTKNSNLVFAPLPEQHRIVAKIEELFSDLDAGVAALRKTQAELKRYRQAVLKAAVEGKLTAEWRAANRGKVETASALLERIRQQRRVKFQQDQIESLKGYIHLRVQSSNIQYDPDEVLYDWLLEMVVMGIDKTKPVVVDEIIQTFFQEVKYSGELKSYVSSYLRWLRSALNNLIRNKIDSQVVQTQMKVWLAFLDEQENPKTRGRSTHTIFGSSYSNFEILKHSIRTDQIRNSGAKFIREKYIEKPVEDRWETYEKHHDLDHVNTSELPELPSGWLYCQLNEVAEVRLGRQRSPSRATGPNMRQYLRAANVTWNGLDLSDVKEMDFSPTELETYRLKCGDILLSEASGSISEVGKPAIWNEQIKDCCFQNTLIRVRSYAPLPAYLHIHFYYDASVERFRKIAKGVGIHHLGAENMSGWVVSIPPLAEQQQIVAEVERRLSVADAVEKTVDASLKQAERLRQSILKRAFAGKLVPQDPNDEPAERLLERIKAVRGNGNVRTRAGTNTGQAQGIAPTKPKRA